jgi:hypothetical protein
MKSGPSVTALPATAIKTGQFRLLGSRYANRRTYQVRRDILLTRGQTKGGKPRTQRLYFAGHFTNIEVTSERDVKEIRRVAVFITTPPPRGHGKGSQTTPRILFDQAVLCLSSNEEPVPLCVARDESKLVFTASKL